MKQDSKKRRAQSPSSGKPELAAKKRSITIGMDLGDKRSRYCVLEGSEVVKEDSVLTKKKELAGVFSRYRRCRTHQGSDFRSGNSAAPALAPSGQD